MTKSTGKNKQRPLSRLEIDPIAGTIDRIMPDGEIRRDIGSNHSNGRYRVVVLNGIMHLNHRLI